jgi:hypothetical protein
VRGGHDGQANGAMAYLMLRPLLSDVPDDEMCGFTVNRVFPASDRWHPLLMRALSGIPDVQFSSSSRRRRG